MTAVAVTQEDIDNGKRCHAQECPFALALARVLPPETKIAVGVYTAQIGESTVRLTREIEQWTADYDYHGQSVSPAVFELDLGEFL